MHLVTAIVQLTANCMHTQTNNGVDAEREQKQSPDIEFKYITMSYKWDELIWNITPCSSP